MKARIIQVKSKKFGEITRITFSNRSKIYLSRKGLTFSIPWTQKKADRAKIKRRFEITASPEELGMLVKAISRKKK